MLKLLEMICSKFAEFSVVLLLNLSLCSAQVVQFGVCPHVEPMKYFNLDKFLGKWYEIKRFPTWYEDFSECAYKTVQACGERIAIEHSYVREDVRYILHINTTFAPGDEAVFQIPENNIDPIGIPLNVINTDYTNYSVLYGCKSSRTMGIKYILAWILSREKTMAKEVLERAEMELNNVPLANLAYLESVKQTEEDCQHNWTAHVNAEYKNPIDEILNNKKCG